MRLLKNKYLTINWDEDHKLLELIYSKETADLTEEIYKEQIIEIVNIAKQYKIEKFLSNLKEFYYPIAPSLQKWINMQFYNKTSITTAKTAIILSTELVKGISIEQAVEESDKKLNLKYFDEYTQARDWLLSK